jgi:C4-dicarboxylate transporter, DctM subunit
MNETMIGLVGLVVLMGLFVMGMELAFAMALIGFVGYAIVVSPEAAMSMVANDFYDALESYGMTVLPLFILMGQIAFNAGVARRLYDSTHKFLGHIPGGLAVATVVGATAFKTMCGSIVATVATFASVAVPEMDRYNYAKKLSTGIVATVGTLGLLIPPAMTLIVLGIITQQSIGQLFLAGLIPGLLLAFLFIVVIFGWARINPEIGPKSEKYSWKERMATVPEVIWPIVIFLVIVGGLMKGFFTPTEAGSVGLFAVMALCVLKGDIGLKGIKQSSVEALRTACMVVLMMICSVILSHFITVTNIPGDAAEWIAGLPFHRHITLCIIFLVYLIGGTFIDDMAFMILATPIFFPAMLKLGYDPLWGCIMISVVIGIGSVIPPIAMCVFVVKNITKVPLNVIYSGVYPFLVSLIVCMVLMFLFPQIVLYVPTAFAK